MTRGIDYVATRYAELDEMFFRWGYTVVPDPDASRWQETFLTSPLTGLVRLSAERGPDGEKIRFRIEEHWAEGDAGNEAALHREGASLVQYHYHGWLDGELGAERWCLFPVAGHTDDPSHHHEFGKPQAGQPPVPCGFIDPEEALTTFETHAYASEAGPSEVE